MKFRDSSALISLLIVDAHSARAQQLSAAEHRAADERFAALSRRWSTIHDVGRVVDESLSLLSRHPLRTGDAIQLAAAVVARDNLTELEFVTFDKLLRSTAHAEGFAVLA